MSTQAPLDPTALAGQLGLAGEVVDPAALQRSVDRCRELGVRLPTFAELADPTTIPTEVSAGLRKVGRDEPHPANLFRVHWHNALHRADPVLEAHPPYLVLPTELTGVAAPIIVVFGEPFPMINAHKVLAAYACLAPRIITGQFDPTRHRAIWPSTGNYARGGIAISRIMGARGVAILPEGMSKERFDWLEEWTAGPEDVIRTPGSESNVKEIYDACNALAADPDNFVFNQFCEFGNHLAHYEITGRALGAVFEHEAVRRRHPGLRLAAFVSATGSAGTIAAGDRLKEEYGSRIVAVEAAECPTMLENGFGEHNIQGIGDKHIPLIHNVMNTDVVVGISDRATDSCNLLFATTAGRAELAQQGVPGAVIAATEHLGLSSIANVLAAVKTARLLDLGPDDAIVTVATDGAGLYESERDLARDRLFGGTFGEREAAATFAEHLGTPDTDRTLECTELDRRRIFNLGYYTWVEQQGTPFEVFEARRDQRFWRDLRGYLAKWDDLITDFNARVGHA